MNNEFYVAIVYNEMINDGKKIVDSNVSIKMYGLWTPKDLDCFIE